MFVEPVIGSINKLIDSSLQFNSIYVVNMNDMDPNHPVMYSSPSVISCFYNDPNKYYSID